MPATPGDRSAYFPKIEVKHGEPIDHWFDVLAALGDAKYPEQIACLRNEHGFSQAHANAVVMTFRGSATSRRFHTPDAFFASLAPEQAKTARAIFVAIRKRFPDLELVIAWNQPMLRVDGQYVFGLSAAKGHLLIAPWSTAVLDAFASRLDGYEVNKKTIRIPNDWTVDATLLEDLVAARLAEVEAS